MPHPLPCHTPYHATPLTMPHPLQVSNVAEYKLLQILGEGYEGKVRH